MPLTDLQIRTAKPAEKPVRLFDGGGLYLEVTPAGGKLWRLKYRFAGKEKRLSFGAYPAVGLKDARERRDDAKRQLAGGSDPGAAKQAEKVAQAIASATTFEAVAREWYEKHRAGWAPSHGDKIIRRLERDVFPWLGARPIAELTAPEILIVLRRIEERGVLETAHRAGQNIGQVFRYAIATGRAERNPVPDLKGALPPWREKTHFAAPTDPAKVGELLRALDGFTGSLPVSIALRLAPLLFVRPGELRTMRWADIDFEREEWRYTTSKTRTEHQVTLAPQALALLRALHPLTGRGEWVFPGGRDPKKAMSNAALGAALKRMGIDTREELTPHGWRATARTLLHERLGFEPAAIEHQLAHAVPDALGNAYNRTKFADERRRMMRAWADYLDQLKAGAEVIPLPSAA